MTEKANEIMLKMNFRRLFEHPQRRDQILRDFNASTMHPVGALGGDKGERFLKELNEMEDLQSNAGQTGSPDR